MSKKQVLPTGIALAASVMLIGLIMRSPITTLPLMLSQISQELGVPSGQLGILTTIPLVMFLLISNFASKTMAVFGLKSIILVNCKYFSGDGTATGCDDANDAVGHGVCGNWYCPFKCLYAFVCGCLFFT